MTLSPTARRPNVLIFMTDQQNAGTIDDGSRIRAKTPNLDRFRKTAFTFANAQAPSPHCCPSRASFHTGLYPSQHGVWNNVSVTNALSRGPRPGTGFWAEDFARAGYTMGYSGKWHVSNWQGPADFGWTLLTAERERLSRSSDPEQQRLNARAHEARVFSIGGRPRISGDPGEIVRPGWPAYSHFGTNEAPFGDEQVVASGERFIDARRGDQAPWMLYVGTLGPHDPYTPPSAFLDLYDADDIELPPSFDDPMWDKPGLYRRTRMAFDQLSRDDHREAIRHYLAFCSYEDALFGRLLDRLQSTGQMNDTIVLYLSDHGDYVAEHGLWGKGLPSFRGAYHVPFVIGGPGITAKGQENSTPVSLVDIGPTLVELCEVATSLPFAGQSLAPELRGETTRGGRPMFFQSNGNEAYGIQRMVIADGWKLVYNMFDHDELYNLEDDPDEMVNLIAPSPNRQVGIAPLAHIPMHLRDRVRSLYALLWRFAETHDDDNINGYILTALAPFGPGVAADETPQLPSAVGG